MKLSKAVNRDGKRSKKINGHRRDGDSVKTIQRLQKERAEELRKKRLEKEELISIE